MNEQEVEPRWNEEPLTMFFESERLFKEFLQEGSKIQVKSLCENLYNSVTSMINFYREYKAGSTPMPQFYYDHVATHYPDSRCCVGNAMLAKDIYLDPEGYFIKNYPDFGRYLYYVCSNAFLYVSLDNIPEKHRERPPVYTGPYKEHVLVALKISLEGRDGFVLIDIGYHFPSPIVVMADGKSPHTEPFEQMWNRGVIRQSFELEGNYVHWVETECREDPAPPKHRWIFVAKIFDMLQDVEKRTRVGDFHAFISRGVRGPEAGVYCIFGKENGVHVYVGREEGDPAREKISLVIPFEYVVSEEVQSNEEYETAIDRCSSKVAMSADNLKAIMKDLAEITADKEFFESLLKLNGKYTKLVVDCWEK